MDKVIIRDLELYAYHGVNEEEKKMGQKFLVSLELFVDTRKAGVTDDLRYTVNYAELCHNLSEKFLAEKYNLIEKAAEELCRYVLLNYLQVAGLKLEVQKPWAPM